MANKIEKIIIAFYSIQILLCVYIFFQIFIKKDLTYNSLMSALLFTPIFLILLFVYKKKYNDIIVKNIKNKFTRYLKFTAWILFFIALIVFIVSVNLIDKNLEKINPDLYDSFVVTTYLIIRDISGLIWPFILILFAINFYKKTDVNQRNQNLNNATWAMFIFGFLILFHKVIGQLIIDIGILIHILLK